VKRFLIFAVFCSVISSCTTLDVFEKTTAFPKHFWEGNVKPTFSFEINDTTSLYNLFVVLRHEDGYRYKNIWLNVQMQAPDTSLSIKREFVLADNTKWLGTAMSDIIEHRINFNNTPVKLKKGIYNFTLQQVMREEPLQYILNAGIRVEKVKP
jgi:gliding motility-associated lipoprotein GldH